MIKKIAWNTFKNTGDVNTFLELRQIQNLEEQMEFQRGVQGQQESENIMGMKQQTEEQNGNNKNEWYNNI